MYCARIRSLKYMAPEVVKSNKANERVDQYSYAIVLWELLSRKGLLFLRTVRMPAGARVEMTPQMWAEQAMKGARPAIAAEWPEALQRVMGNCWHHDPLKRPRFADVMGHLQPELKPELFTDPTKPSARVSKAQSSNAADAGCACCVQ
jgi:serine/threonine protein kinase